MELPILLLMIAALWLMLLPSRIAGTFRRHRLAGAAVVAAVVLGGFALLQVSQPHQPSADYAQGDTALRALLE